MNLLLDVSPEVVTCN